MAFSHQGNCAAYQSKTDSNAGTTNANINAGDLVVFVLATDNYYTEPDGENYTWHTAVTIGGYSMTCVRGEHDGTGTSWNSSAVSIWVLVAPANISSGAAITCGTNGGISAIAYTAHRFTFSGSGVQKDAAAGSNGNGNLASLAISGLASAHRLYFRGSACETSSTTAITPTSGFTALTGNQTAGGGSASNMSVRGEFKIATSTGETSDPSYTTSDEANAFVALSEIPLPSRPSISVALQAVNRAGRW